MPCTKLGRLVRDGKIRSMEQVFLFSLPIKEYQITDLFMKDTLKDEVMQIMPVQKQTSAGQRTRFKCVVAVGDYNGHIGMGTKCAKEVATAIRGGINAAKCAVVPVRRGYWGAKIGQPHTVPIKLTGKCGSVRIRLVPAARGTGIVASPTSKKVLQMEKQRKLNVLDKSKMDWKEVKASDASMEEDLEKHKKGKTYLEEQDFLKRAELREYEIERDARLAGDVRSRGRL